MPVYLKPDEEMPDVARSADPQRDRADLIEGLLAGCRSSLACVIVGVILLPVMLFVMRPTLEAADKLFHRGSDFWQESLMPTVLFAFFGAGFGALLGWRMSASASLTGFTVWLITGAAVLILMVVGGCAAMMIFANGVPTMCCISLAVMGLSTLVAMYLYGLWGG